MVSRRGAGLLALLVTACSGPSGDASETEGATQGGHEPAPRADEHGTFAVGGITIDRITIDQAVAIDVYAQGAPIAPEGYPTQLVAHRNAYVRALWDVPEDWEAREIEARIGIHHANGDVDYGSKILNITQPSNENWLEGAFAWYLPAEWMEPGLALDVTLYETDPSHAEGTPPRPGARAPMQGAFDVEVTAAAREMDVLIVRIEHTYDGGHQCGGAPEVDEAMRVDMEQRLLAINPMQKVNVSVRDEVMIFDQPANAFAVILDELSALREKDGAPPWLYYYGLIDLCDWGSDQGFSGQARVPDELTKDYAWKRVAVGTVRASYGGILGTFVHELGHTQGRYHVPCDGEQATEDDYPYRDAIIASMGFDIVTWTLHPSTRKDYMSYCDPSWVGDYGWNKSLPVSETLTKWKLEGASWDEPPQSLVGSIYPDGTERWWVVRGQPTLESAGAALRFSSSDRDVIEVGARVRPHALGDGLEVVAPLPLPLAEIVAIERVGIPGPSNIDVAQLAAH